MTAHLYRLLELIQSHPYIFSDAIYSRLRVVYEVSCVTIFDL